MVHRRRVCQRLPRPWGPVDPDVDNLAYADAYLQKALVAPILYSRLGRV